MKIVTHVARVTNQEEAEAFFAALRKSPRKGMTLSHVTFTVVPLPPSKVKRPTVAVNFWGDWSGISFWF